MADLGEEAGCAELQQFVLLAQAAKGSGCAALIRQALSHPKVYVFGELLTLPNVQELGQTEHAVALGVLNLFAYGTWKDVTPEQRAFLDDDMVHKLKKLSIVSKCAGAHTKKYAEIMQAVEIGTVRELEDMIISLIYEGLLQAKLNQREKEVDIRFAFGRDVREDDLPLLDQKLTSWCGGSAGSWGSRWIAHQLPFAQAHHVCRPHGLPR